jgi:hypothetical protein
MTDEEIKAKYGNVDKIEIFVGAGDSAIGYLIKPSRYVLSPIIAKIQTDPVAACEIWLESCLIKEISDPRMLSDDIILISAMAHMDGIIALKKSKLTSI